MTLSDRRVDRLLDEAEDALEQGDASAALDLIRTVLDARPHHAGAHFLAGEAMREIGHLEAAEASFREAAAQQPDHAPTWASLAAVQFDQLEFVQAETAWRRALRLDPDSPDAWFGVGLVRERREDWDGAERAFLRAHFLDPIQHPLPVPLDDATVEAIVAEVVGALHPAIQSWLASVSIVLEEVPDTTVCRQFDPPAPPGEILGLFTGPSRAERSMDLDTIRSGDNAWSLLPPSIVLYRRNLERMASDREQLIEQLRVTVFHEIGHYLGLDEDDLAARGLD